MIGGAPQSLGLSVAFTVVVDGLSLGEWSSCSGLELKAKLHKMHNPGDYDTERIFFADVSYDPVKLERAIDGRTSATARRWVADHFAFYRQPGYNPLNRLFGGETATVTLCDAARKPLATWNLRNVYPYKYKGPTLTADKAGIAKETLELAHEGFL